MKVDPYEGVCNNCRSFDGWNVVGEDGNQYLFDGWSCDQCMTEKGCPEDRCGWEVLDVGDDENNPHGGICNLCGKGHCAVCSSEQLCGVNDHCEWQSDGVSGGTCSDTLVTPTSMNFYDCVEYCNNDVEGGRIPCVESQEEQDLLWARGDGGYIWLGLFQTTAGVNEVEDWIDETCDSSFTNWLPGFPANAIEGLPPGDFRCTILVTFLPDGTYVGGLWIDGPCDLVPFGLDNPTCVCRPTSSPAVIDMESFAGEV